MTNAQIDGNKTISSFMGNTFQGKKAMKYYQNEIQGQDHPDRTGLKYHNSYDWLMPVANSLIDSHYGLEVDLDDLMTAGGRFDLEEIFTEVVVAIIRIERTV